MMEHDPSKTLRRGIMALLIVASTGLMTGRILSVSNAKADWPFFSANDRSRWCTIRALVDEDTYEIDEVIQTPGWDTIDKVQHEGRDGKQHSYSSKPPLYPTILSGQYWLIRRASGVSLLERPFYIVRLMLVLTNVLPMILYLSLIAAIVERYGQTDWGRIYVVAAAAFGTMLTTFAVTLNNHLPAAVSVALTLWATSKILREEKTPLWVFALAGLGAAFAAANELPALSFLAAISLILLWKSFVRTLLVYLPAVAVVVAGFFGTNYLAHDDWRPPYFHRRDGEVLTQIDASLADTLDRGVVPPMIIEKLENKTDFSADVAVEIRQPGDRWVLIDLESERRLALVREGDNEKEQRIAVRAWDHWYDYPGSYWLRSDKTGVDAGERKQGIYAMHMTVGHHGIFSLTPIWILSFVGLGWLVIEKRYSLRWIALMIIALSLICIAFYIARPQNDRNYGGISCCFRWMLWFAPMWLLAMLPVVDFMAARRSTRILASILLVLSVASATYASINPWQHPWLYRYWEYLGWAVKSGGG